MHTHVLLKLLSCTYNSKSSVLQNYNLSKLQVYIKTTITINITYSCNFKSSVLQKYNLQHNKIRTQITTLKTKIGMLQKLIITTFIVRVTTAITATKSYRNTYLLQIAGLIHELLKEYNNTNITITC